MLSKNILFLTYYFPPGASSGVFRPLKFIKYFKKNNLNPIVVTMKDEYYKAFDNSLLGEIPENISVHRVNSLEPTNGQDNKAVYHEVQLPDHAYGAVMHFVVKCLQIIKTTEIDFIFCTAPPNSLLLAAKMVKEITGLPLFVDYRDGWNYTNPFNIYRTDEGKEINLYFEKEVLKSVDGLIAVDEKIVTGIERLNKDKIPYIIVRNGYDSEDKEKALISYIGHEDEIIISYCGFIYSSYYDIFQKLIQVMDKLNRSLTKKIRLVIAGSLQDKSVLKLFDSNSVTYLGQISYYESLGIEKISNASLSIMIHDHSLPSKIYNSMMFKNKIIVFTNKKNSTIRHVLKNYSQKALLDIYSSELTIEKALTKWLFAINEGVTINDDNNIIEYERSYQVKQIINFVKRTLG